MDDWTKDIIQFCMIVTFASFPLLFAKEFINSLPLLIQPIFILIFGIAGIGVYFPFGVKLYELMKEEKTK